MIKDSVTSCLRVGQLSRYSDWLRAGQSRDRIPAEARLFAPVQTGPGAHPASCTMGTGSLPGIKSGRGVTLTPHTLLLPLVMKEQSYISTPPIGRTACTEPQCLYKGDLYLFFISCLQLNRFLLSVFTSTNCISFLFANNPAVSVELLQLNLLCKQPINHLVTKESKTSRKV